MSQITIYCKSKIILNKTKVGDEISPRRGFLVSYRQKEEVGILVEMHCMDSPCLHLRVKESEIVWVSCGTHCLGEGGEERGREMKTQHQF